MQKEETKSWQREHKNKIFKHWVESWEAKYSDQKSCQTAIHLEEKSRREITEEIWQTWKMFPELIILIENQNPKEVKPILELLKIKKEEEPEEKLVKKTPVIQVLQSRR